MKKADYVEKLVLIVKEKCDKLTTKQIRELIAKHKEVTKV